MRKYLLLLTLISKPVWAQDDQEAAPLVIQEAVPDTWITVVASGDRVLITSTGQPLSLIGVDEIEQVQGADIVRMVERLPGVTVTRNGGPGSFTGVRVRGAEAEQLLVLVDGVRVADTAAPGGGFDFGTLLPAGISKIELLRGSNSTIWGSQAMGGVLAVTTFATDGVRGSAEYGGSDTAYLQASAGKPWGPLIWGLDGAFLDSQGISSAASGTERDGLRQWQAGGRAEVALAPGFVARATARHLDARLDLDGFPLPAMTLADTAEYQDTRRTDASAGLEHFGGRLELRATWSLSDTRRESFDPGLGSDPAYTTHGRDQRAELRGKWHLAPITLHFGGERAWSRMETLFDARTRAGSRAAYAQLGFRNGRVALNGGLRVEDHARFGSAWTFGADGALGLGREWRLRASYGEGFKAPTLFQLLSDFGNPALRPERSRGFDFGIERGDRNGRLHLAASLFRRDSTDLIGFVSCFGTSEGVCAGHPMGTYDNIARTRAQGIEFEAAIQPTDRLRVQGAWSLVEAGNRTPGGPDAGRDLVRHPHNAATLSTDWSTPWIIELGADLRVVSGSFDDAANTVRLGGYPLVTLRAAWPLGEHLELFGRVENVFDEDYQTAAGYGTPGRGAYIGARARY